jgi:putative endonuclease
MGKTSSGKLDVGQVGERVVAQWLRAQGWGVLAERWHCRLGELDIVAAEPASKSPDQTIAFVEVKTRRSRNWDLNGLLSITPSKQKKLVKTAQLYLVAHPEFEMCPCRFDVALVQVVSGPVAPIDADEFPWVEFGGDRLRLRQYIRSAFEA